MGESSNGMHYHYTSGILITKLLIGTGVSKSAILRKRD